MRPRHILVAATVALVASNALAHVSVRPRESKPGATEHYTMRVPTEGKVATTSVELDVPEGVTIVAVDGAADSHQEKKIGDRMTGVTWKVTIAPGEAQEFTFSAKNPTAGTEIAWKVRQLYSDGTSSDWVEPAGSRRPAPVTKLSASQ